MLATARLTRGRGRPREAVEVTEVQDVLVWQLVDSAFPTGAFAHSLGLEAAWQHGEIAGREDLRRFVEATILQAATGALPLVNASAREPRRLDEWDALADAFLSNAVANRASRQQGRTLLASAARIFASSTLDAFHARVLSTPNFQLPTPNRLAHVAPMTGVVFAALGVALETTQRVVLFTAARSVLSAAVRLGITGSYDAQRLQAEAAPWMADVLARYRDAGPASLAQTAPIIDILQGAHDRIYSRLFQS
jgi:urease accessory protein